MNNVDLNDNKIQIYKTSDLLYVKTNDDKKKTINIYNVAGQKVLSTTFFETTSMPIEALTKGIYIVSVENSVVLKSIKIWIE
ncbi:MAG: hypothetical protein RI955_631 [Bacteroidota bacterium]